MTFHIGIPQFLFIVLLFTALILHTANHGKSKGNYHAGYAALTVFIELLILYFGGFFN